MSTAQFLRYFGSLDALDSTSRNALVERTTSIDPGIRDTTAGILTDVRARGDAALRELALRFDHIALERIEVPRPRWKEALDRLAPALRRSMERSVENIASVHRAFLPSVGETSPEPGIVVGRRPDPLDRVGVYAPGGRAAYPSSVLMGAVPARVAGVRDVVICSPPGQPGGPAAWFSRPRSWRMPTGCLRWVVRAQLVRWPSEPNRSPAWTGSSARVTRSSPRRSSRYRGW